MSDLPTNARTPSDDIRAGSPNGQDPTSLNAWLERELIAAIAELDGASPLLGRMARFHLGWIDATGTPTTGEQRLTIQGKRLRPHLAMLSCAAAGGNPEDAAPLAAAIELLHNFTLIHDDIQDRSPNRRHRATVWRIWGDAQAINAGDAMFATAQLALLRTSSRIVSPATLLDLLTVFNRMTIDIVRGQVLDVDFEGRDDVRPEDYLEMIRLKTSVIVRFATWAGARIGGGDTATADRFAEFGEALGVGFQIRDDFLGIWGARDVTGKETADDIRRRKQTLPILLLRALADEHDAALLDTLYRAEEIDADGIATVMRMLEARDIASRIDAHIRSFHDRAAASLRAIDRAGSPGVSGALSALVARLEQRTS